MECKFSVESTAYLLSLGQYNCTKELMRLIIITALILQIAHVYADTGTNNSNNKQAIIWSLIPYAPIHILEGEFKSQGIADQYLKSAQKELVGYKHINEVMTPARAWYSIASAGAIVCHPSAIKTSEREKLAYFSDAALITPVIRVLMRKSDWQDRLQGANQLNYR